MLSGDNGILNKAGQARDDSIVGQEKEQVELAYISAAVKKLGDNVDKDDLQDELDASVGENKTTVTGTSTLKVKFEGTKNEYKVTRNGVVSKINNNQTDEIQEMLALDNKIVILNEEGELSYINFEQPDSSQFVEIDISEKNIINNNVKELFSNGSYLTNNGELYILADNGQYYKKADNVKKVYPDIDMEYISNNNELFFFDWANPVTANYEKYAENVKEFFGNYSYSMLDGTSKIRLNRDGSFITINEDIRYFSNGYYITSDDDLYKENTSVKGEFNKVAENVKKFEFDAYLSNNGEIFKKSGNEFVKIAQNVRYSNSGDYYDYVSNDNELYYNPTWNNYEKIASNVKDYTRANNGEYIYITTNNRLFIGDTDTGYEISKYGIKNKLWIKTTNNEIYYYYEPEAVEQVFTYEKNR